jgi:hypothetical protein
MPSGRSLRELNTGDSGRRRAERYAPNPPALPAPKPALQVGSIHDAEYQDDAIGLDDVVHHPVVAGAQPVKGVVGPADGLDGLAGDASRAGDVVCESFEGLTDAIAVGASKLLELPYRRPRELDLVRGQSRSSSRTVRRSAKSARACLR